jgi:uncharacterized protein YndB with AHSA1/START domain
MTQSLPTLEVTTPSDREIAMTRVFDAPRRLVFEALTTPELLSRWLLGPPGWSMKTCEVDLQVGGSYRYVWQHSEKPSFGLHGVFREITPPERIVHSEVFDGPFNQEEALVTTVLSEDNNRTKMTVTILCASKEARDQSLKSGMTKGAAMSYDRLAELLTSRRSGQATQSVHSRV